MKSTVYLLFSLLFLCSCAGSGSDSDARLDAVRQLGNDASLQFIPDRRLGVFDISYRLSGKELTVKGQTTSTEAHRKLLDALAGAGYTVRDSVRLLPDSVGLDGKIYGVVNLSVCNIRRSNDFASEMLTQGLLGMPVNVFERASWYRVQTPDNYIGWVHSAGIVPMTKDELNAWLAAPKVVVTAHYGFTYERPDARAQSVSDVVSGDRLRLEGTEGGFYKVSYPDGRVAYISRTIAQTEPEWRKALRQDAASILQTAHTLVGVPYLWAGTSAKGMDCSGFVRTVLIQHDIIIPRDASQQAYVGQHIDIAPDFSNLKPGDLIFFGRKATADRKERVVHVAFSLGGKRFIHSQGDVRINSFDPADKEYDEYNLNRLLFATRVLDSIGTENINTTATNRYYLPR